MCAEGMLRTKQQQRRQSNLPEATVGKNKPKMSSLDCRSTRATRTLDQLWINFDSTVSRGQKHEEQAKGAKRRKRAKIVLRELQ